MQVELKNLSFPFVDNQVLGGIPAGDGEGPSPPRPPLQLEAPLMYLGNAACCCYPYETKNLFEFLFLLLPTYLRYSSFQLNFPASSSQAPGNQECSNPQIQTRYPTSPNNIKHQLVLFFFFLATHS